MRPLPSLLVLLGIGLSSISEASAASALDRGDYAEAIKESRASSLSNPRAAETILHALRATGKYAEAARLAAHVAGRFPEDASLQFACHEAFQAVGQTVPASQVLMNAARSVQGGYDPDKESPANAAARAKALVLLGVDPRQVLDRILNVAITASPDAIEPRLATAEIALDKRDNLLASETLLKAREKFPDNADIRFGMARALDDPMAVSRYLRDTLERNPHHVPAMIFRASQATDAGDFDTADKALDAVLEVNPASPEAWAQKAVLAELRGEDPAPARNKALEPWPENPEVDFRIGTGLGHRYRFAESIEALQSALAMDPQHLPTHFELGSNLLRFGREQEGWEHIDLVNARDPYHVAAFNLITLRDAMADMVTLRGQNVDVRMSRADAAVIGDRVTELSAQAAREFAEKYDVELPFRVTVDMLPTQKDFEVRTFSLPIGEGFLGVCFGPLITTCSPRGRLGRSNWEAILWHEMAHTFTLTKTRHRIPRWLSEGLSVHEENLAHAGWGMGMNSERRGAILEDEFPAMQDFDDLFSGDIDLAYFYSGLAAEFLVDSLGTDGMNRLLDEMAKNKNFPAALAVVSGGDDSMEGEFRKFARGKAEAYCPRIDWTPLSDLEYDLLRTSPDTFLAWSPNRYAAATTRAVELAESGDWQGAIDTLEPLVALAPDLRESPSPHALLATAYRELGNEQKETEALNNWLAGDAGAMEAASRLLEIATSNSGDILAVSNAVLAIDPFNLNALRAHGRAAIANGDIRDGAATYEAFLSLDPIDSVRARMELARALHEHGSPGARRQTLMVLEENPRFESALDLLQEINGKVAQ